MADDSTRTPGPGQRGEGQPSQGQQAQGQTGHGQVSGGTESPGRNPQPNDQTAREPSSGMGGRPNTNDQDVE